MSDECGQWRENGMEVEVEVEVEVEEEEEGQKFED